MHDIAQMLMMAAAGRGGQASRATGGQEAQAITPASSYTTAALAIGSAAASRLVVVALAHYNGATPAATTQSVTIGGIAATQLGRTALASNDELSVWAAAVPTGTTAAVAVTADRNVSAYLVAAEAVYGAIATPAYVVEGVQAGAGAITGVRKGLVLVALAESNGLFTAAVTDSQSMEIYSPAGRTLSVAYALPSATASVSPLTSGSGGMPYVALSLAPI